MGEYRHFSLRISGMCLFGDRRSLKGSQGISNGRDFWIYAAFPISAIIKALYR